MNVMMGSSLLLNSAGYQISRSVRLRSSATAYLNRTPASAGNRKTWTWSGWVKRGLGSAADDRMLFSGTTNGTSTIGGLFFNGGGESLRYIDLTTPATFQTNVTVTPVYRDFSAWYHIVLAVDTTQATAANRIRFFVNGVEVTTFAATVYPSQNADTFINAAQQHRIGTYPYSTSGPFDGYLTEVNFIDGQALTPSSFGVTNAYGVWSPIKYNGTYGTNGFYLNFSDNSNNTATTIGKDYSGNGNNWTPNNISVTAGATYDSMIDVPTPWGDGGNGRGNYATLNPLQSYGTGTLTLTNGNLTSNKTATNSDSGWTSTFALSSGKWYAEYLFTGASVGGNNGGVGVMRVASTSVPGELSDTVRWMDAGTIRKNAASTSYGTALVANDILMVAFDADNNQIWFGKNGTWFASGDPATNTNPSATGLTNPMVPATYHFAANSVTIDANYGQRPFAYTPPSGFKALNTFNLPEPTIANGALYMTASLYTGTGANLTVTNTTQGVTFQPDFVWIKGRSGATDHALYDAVRGTQNDLVSNSTAAATTQSTGLTAFNSNGFTVGTLAKLNTNTATYVAWQWNAGGSTVTNTSGSISAQVRASTTAGFSIVTYTGTGANATVGHGLGAAPKMIIVKQRDAITDWYVYHTNLAATDFIRLNLTNAKGTNTGVWNSTAPTSTVFSLGGYTEVDANTKTYVAYCFASITGFSAFGSYTGNGSADGPFVFCGFRPRYVMVKRTDAIADWYLIDTARDTYNVASNILYPNLSNAEAVNGLYDYLSNGFKLRNSGSAVNASGGTYIFAAFAEVPFRNALAR